MGAVFANDCEVPSLGRVGSDKGQGSALGRERDCAGGSGRSVIVWALAEPATTTIVRTAAATVKIRAVIRFMGVFPSCMKASTACDLPPERRLAGGLSLPNATD